MGNLFDISYLRYKDEPMATPSASEWTQRATVVSNADCYYFSSLFSLFVIGVITDSLLISAIVLLPALTAALAASISLSI